MATKGMGIIRRETATRTGDLIKNSCGSLMAAETKPGVWLFGFNAAAPEHLDDVFRCDADGTREWAQHTTEPFLLRTWACQKILLPENTERGEIETVRTVLIDPEGETLSFVSAGVLTSLDLIRTMFGDGPFDPPLPLTVAVIKSANGRQVLKLRPQVTGARKPK